MRKLILIEAEDGCDEWNIVAREGMFRGVSLSFRFKHPQVREATPDDIRAAFIEQAEASGEAGKVREYIRSRDEEGDGVGGIADISYGSAGGAQVALEVLGLSPLLGPPKEAPDA